MERELIWKKGGFRRKYLIHKVFHASATRNLTLLVQLTDEADMETSLHCSTLVGSNAPLNA